MKKQVGNMDWTTLPRLETSDKRLDDQILDDGVIAKNLGYGIHLYRNAIKKEDCINLINDLEKEISLGIPQIRWSNAQVNDSEEVSHARNCLDLRFKRENLGKQLPENKALYDIHTKVEIALDKCLRHYESLWHLQMQYKEAFNFVKYLPGKYFKVHADHGPYYVCTISAVVYLNDDYEGGEIQFGRHGLTIKPEAGDILINPSTYVYEHASLEIRSGIKYAVVIMTDYNDIPHHPGKGYGD